MSNQVWTIDASHSVVEFAVKHMMFATAKGRFGELEGTITGDPADLSGGSIDVSIDAASIDTRSKDRDDHLRSADFFDVENHPKLTYKSRSIQKTGDNEYTIEGDLTIRGVTKPVTLSAVVTGTGKDPWGNQRAGFQAETSINRKDFGLTWNAALEAGGVLVGDEVKISIDVEAVLQQ